MMEGSGLGWAGKDGADGWIDTTLHRVWSAYYVCW